jgi:hypothetical protein
LLKTHGIDFRLSAGNKRPSFDLIEQIVMMKHCDVGVATVHSRDAELAAVDPADSVLDVELDQASFRHSLYRVVQRPSHSESMVTASVMAYLPAGIASI